MPLFAELHRERQTIKIVTHAPDVAAKLLDGRIEPEFMSS
jgi:hypothetical protein